MQGKDSKCAGGFACAGGSSHGLPCTSNANCSGGQCTVVRAAKGITAAITKAKGRLRARIAQFCSPAMLSAIGFPNSRCPSATDPATVADCILKGAVGDVAGSAFADVSVEIMGRAGPSLVPQGPDPISVCGIQLARVLSLGSEADPLSPDESGEADPLKIVGCAGTLFTTAGPFSPGSSFDRTPVQTYAGTIPICLATRSTEYATGNGTSAHRSCSRS